MSAQQSLPVGGLSDWDANADFFRMGHRDLFTGSEPYETYEPAYRYGWDLAGNDRYRTRAWEDIEPDVRRDWESRNPGGAWERFKAAVRRGWERASDAVEHVIPGDSDRDGR